MKVYVITAGCYSSYRICAVTLDADRAEELVEIYTGCWETAGVEVYETEDYAEALSEFAASRLPFRVAFDKFGNVTSADRHSFENFRTRVEPFNYHRARALPPEKRIAVYLYATDEAAAVKIAAEKRAEFLAQKEGLS